MKPSFRLLVLCTLRYLVDKQTSPWGPNPRDTEGELIIKSLDDAIEEEKKESK